MSMSATQQEVTAALNRVLDPCSLGRGQATGLVDMGMVVTCDVTSSGLVKLTLRLTSPACHFHIWFEQRVRDEVLGIAGITAVSIEWSKDFDWWDSDRVTSGLLPVSSGSGSAVGSS